MSRNLFIGADLLVPYRSADPLAAAAGVFHQIVASDVPGRARAVAGEIASARPEVVGLQECYRIAVTPEGAEEPVLVLDFLEQLTGALAAAGLPYHVAAVKEHTDVTVPVAGLGVRVRVVDREAILTGEGVEVLSSGGGDFLARCETVLGGVLPLRQLRGWTEARLRHAGVELTFVNAHLEVRTFGAIQALQARELLARVHSARQLVLVGDLNSDPRDPPIPYTPSPGAEPVLLPTPYSLLSGALVDAFTAVGDDPPLTCCFDANLAPPSRELFERVDHVFTTPNVEAAAVYRTGTEPLDDLADAAGTPRWPSDHAGVVSVLRLEERTSVERVGSAEAVAP